MIAFLFKTKHKFAPWLLHWNINGIPYYSAFRSKKEATEYGRAMNFIIKLEKR